MANVYGGCLLNIAASSARDSSQGCFSKRKNLPRCHVSLKINENTNFEYDFVSGSADLRHHTDLCPLESRGWTLQERLLSPRTVHFTRKEVFWECRTKIASETLPFDASRPGVYETKEPLSIKNWAEIMSRYSTRRFTYEKDRLIALSGIAQTIFSETKFGYCAGIWYDNLRELCWVTFDEHAEKVFPKRAQTWSWASIKSTCYSIFQLGTGFDKVSKVLKLERPRSDNPFGDMPDAVLWLSCPPLVVAKVTGRYR